MDAIKQLRPECLQDIAEMIRDEYVEMYGNLAITDMKVYRSSVKHHFNCGDHIFYSPGVYVAIVGQIQDPFLKFHDNFVYHVYIRPEHRKGKVFKGLLDGLVGKYGIITGDTLIQSENFRVFSSRNTPVRSVKFLIGG